MEKKTKIGLGIVIGTLVAGIVGVNLIGGPQTIIDIINTGNNSNRNLTKLDKVTNINVDEKSKMITFDEVENCNSYEIKIDNLNLPGGGYTYTTQVGSYKMNYFEKNSITGHTFEISIISKGDYFRTADSEPAVTYYTLQHETERLYNTFTKDFYAVTYVRVNDAIEGRNTINSIDTIDFKDGNFIVKGSATDYRKNDYYFTTITPAKINVSDFSLPETVNVLNASLIDNASTIAVYTAGMVDVTPGLLAGQSETFKQYTDQGYQINTLQQTNSEFLLLANNTRSFTVNGVYQAVNGEEKITFEANHTVTMSDDSAYTTPEMYFAHFNETGDARIVDGEVTIYNADLMNHLEIMQEYHTQQVNEQTNQPANQNGLEL